MALAIPRAAGMNRDLARQILNLALANAQWVVVMVGYALGTNSNFDQGVNDPPIIPAGYAFAIWGFIYPAALAYAVFQALPRQRENELLRRVGWFTASAYLAMTAWILAAQQNLVWLTVAIIVWMLASLVGAFVQITSYRAPLSKAERLLVVVPISVHTGWLTVATVANIAAALWASGVRDVFLPAVAWACLMTIIAGLVGALVTYVSRGNRGYGLTIIWALIGIVVANSAGPGLSIAITAGLMTLAVAALARGRANAIKG